LYSDELITGIASVVVVPAKAHPSKLLTARQSITSKQFQKLLQGLGFLSTIPPVNVFLYVAVEHVPVWRQKRRFPSLVIQGSR
jgi:hypothetical protein